jgi:hypothetical protein
MLRALLTIALGATAALADDDRSSATARSDLVKQANAPVSSILQIRLQDSYAPQFWEVVIRTLSIAGAAGAPPEATGCSVPAGRDVPRGMRPTVEARSGSVAKS